MLTEFEKVYERFKKPIHRYVSSKTKDPDLAEELTQEVFLKAYRAQDTYDRRFGVSTWLWTIARNTITDWFRREPVESAKAQAVPVEELICPNLDAESDLIDRYERSRLFRIVEGLTHLQKKALSLHLIERLSIREIAQALELTPTATKALVYRARCAVLAGATV
jgi:RNA polymerase sigma-70 factor (ECF subfamily)